MKLFFNCHFIVCAIPSFLARNVTIDAIQTVRTFLGFFHNLPLAAVLLANSHIAGFAANVHRVSQKVGRSLVVILSLFWSPTYTGIRLLCII
mgnify:CR=1 FL=1